MSKHHKKRKSLSIKYVLAAVLLLGTIGGLIIYNHSDQITQPNSTEINIGDQESKESQESQKGQPTTNTSKLEDKKLQDFFKLWADQRSASWSISLQEVSNSVDNSSLRQASYDANAIMIPASTYKVYVAYAVLHDIESGIYTMNKSTKLGMSVGSCVNQMIISSDNDCAWALGSLAGWDHVNILLKERGLNSTDINNYAADGYSLVGDKQTTAADAAKMLDGLYDGGWLSDNDTDYLLDLMKQQIWREMLPAGLPAGIDIASKSGWLDGIQNDVAIIYGPTSTYILTVYTTEWSPSSLATFSEYIYNYFATGSLPISL